MTEYTEGYLQSVNNFYVWIYLFTLCFPTQNHYTQPPAYLSHTAVNFWHAWHKSAVCREHAFCICSKILVTDIQSKWSESMAGKLKAVIKCSSFHHANNVSASLFALICNIYRIFSMYELCFEKYLPDNVFCIVTTSYASSAKLIF